MARLPRIALPDLPYHVTQRGNRRQAVFFQPEDRRLYLDLLRRQAQQYGLEIWAYCLMTNHVHLVVVPRREGALTRAIAETHRRYTRAINFRQRWRGYLWQGRFGSVALDEAHLIAAIRYVERNPVTAQLVPHAAEYPWSSAPAHVTGAPDAVLSHCFLQDQIQDWQQFLADPADDAFGQRLGQSSIGRPLGSPAFLAELEQRTGRRLRRGRPGRPVQLLK
jgi:putative transposase